MKVIWQKLKIRKLKEDLYYCDIFFLFSDLLKWWGQYIESQGEMQTALKIYNSAGDIYSQVRVLCFLGEESKAAELARNGRDKAAFYHMARFYETTGNSEEAVNFFTKANAYSESRVTYLIFCITKKF